MHSLPVDCDIFSIEEKVAIVVSSIASGESIDRFKSKSLH